MEDASIEMNHESAIVSILKQFHEQGKYCDVQVLVDKKLFKCQRAMLAANSKYFDDRFSGDKSKKSNASAQGTITLPGDIDAAAFETLLRFMYTGQICAKDSNFVQILLLSDFLRLRTHRFKKLMIQYVRDRCEELKPMSCAIDLLRYACDEEENVFVDILSAHICRHLFHFWEDAQLMVIPFDHLKALLERSKNYIVPLPGSSDVLVKIVHKWVNYNLKARSKCRLELMKNVDSANVSFELVLFLMNELGTVEDDVLFVKVYSEVTSFPELKSLVAALDVFRLGINGPRGIISGNWPPLHIIELPIGLALCTSPCMISNILWKISLKRSTSDGLDVYLCCEGPELASEWNIYAEASFTIKSYKGKEFEDFGVSLSRRLFSSSDSVPRGWVLESFLPLNVLVDPKNGYIAEDNSITLEAEVIASIPFLSYNPQ